MFEPNYRVDHPVVVALVVCVLGILFVFLIGRGHWDWPHSLSDVAILLVSIPLFGLLGGAGLLIGGGILWGVCYLYVSLVSGAVFGLRIEFKPIDQPISDETSE